MKVDELIADCSNMQKRVTDAVTALAFVNDTKAREMADDEDIHKWVQRQNGRVFESEITEKRATAPKSGRSVEKTSRLRR